MTILLPCTIVTLLRHDSIELKELLTYLLTYFIFSSNAANNYEYQKAGIVSVGVCVAHGCE